MGLIFLQFDCDRITGTAIVLLQVEFIICLLLTILGYIPGIIYALYAIVYIDRDQYFDEYRRPLYAA